MKKSLNSALRCNRKSFAQTQSSKGFKMNAFFMYSLMMIGLFFTACTKDMDLTGEVVENSAGPSLTTENNIVHHYHGISWQTRWELQQARAATARYRNIENAMKDGYTDINVVVQNMGHHYLKPSLVDGNFDIRKPEILVYNKLGEDSYELVAVEYAVPLSLSTNAPEGFTGNADVWDRNTGFGLWLLHAWVWHHNPDGVFNPTNKQVHLH